MLEAQTNVATKAASDSVKATTDTASGPVLNPVQAESLRLKQFSTQLEKAFRQNFIELTRNESPESVLDKFQLLPAGSYLFKSKARNEMETIVDSMVLCKTRLDSLALNQRRLTTTQEKLDDIEEFAEFLQDAINRGEIAERSRLDRIITNAELDKRSYESDVKKAKSENEIYRIYDEIRALIERKTQTEMNKILLKNAFREATRLVTLRFYEQIGKGVPRDTLKVK